MIDAVRHFQLGLISLKFVQRVPTFWCKHFQRQLIRTTPPIGRDHNNLLLQSDGTEADTGQKHRSLVQQSQIVADGYEDDVIVLYKI